jgi:hypothetical protein
MGRHSWLLGGEGGSSSPKKKHKKNKHKKHHYVVSASEDLEGSLSPTSGASSSFQRPITLKIKLGDRLISSSSTVYVRSRERSAGWELGCVRTCIFKIGWDMHRPA